MTELHRSLRGYQVFLDSVTEQELELIRQWRNDPAVSQFMLSQQLIDKEQQQAWFKKISNDSSQQHFMIRYKDQNIGVANIKACYQGETLLNSRAIEPGLYIADERYRSNILAFAPTLLLNDYCFDVLGTACLKACVKADNQAALHYNSKLGYQIEKQADLVEIVLYKDDYQRQSQGLKALLSRPSLKNQ
ncbi:GNAT family N-acetyltransferase [Paraglaciecola sp.]|uniref:GNAT family N-acetyltransferase n=1 Tax=Paraglaciecola sp. TaxID=1920173 RepID=UPI00273FF8DC|nr:GNAT family N-acetyltransferase [Paraglaciecola sp.]MDP5029279.1 GNAT family N-acetyltransferase [Paraglaciecola sp.]